MAGQTYKNMTGGLFDGTPLEYVGRDRLAGLIDTAKALIRALGLADGSIAWRLGTEEAWIMLGGTGQVPKEFSESLKVWAEHSKSKMKANFHSEDRKSNSEVMAAFVGKIKSEFAKYNDRP